MYKASLLHRRGFTMVELLVAIALGLIIMGMVGYCFHHTQRAANRALAMLEAHHKARVAIDLIKRDLEAMHPCCGMSLADLDTDGTSDQLTFMTSVRRTDVDGEEDTEISSWPYDGEDYSYDLMWVTYTFRKIDNDTGDQSFTCALLKGVSEPDSLSPPAPSASAAGAVLGHTILEGVSGEFDRLPVSEGTINSLHGIALDGSTSPSDRPHKITIQNVRVMGTDTGGFGTTVGVTFEQTIYLPRDR